MVNSLLYRLSPDYESRRPGKTVQSQAVDELKLCIAMICQRLTVSNDKVF